MDENLKAATDKEDAAFQRLKRYLHLLPTREAQSYMDHVFAYRDAVREAEHIKTENKMQDD